MPTTVNSAKKVACVPPDFLPVTGANMRSKPSCEEATENSDQELREPYSTMLCSSRLITWPYQYPSWSVTCNNLENWPNNNVVSCWCNSICTSRVKYNTCSKIGSALYDFNYLQRVLTCKSVLNHRLAPFSKSVWITPRCLWSLTWTRQRMKEGNRIETRQRYP